jgi:enterochelin esterase family protein
MKNSILFGLILLLLAAAALPVLAQPQPIQSPDVHPDRSVTFRFRAPNAKEVSLHLEGTKNTPMQKDGEGVWTVTTEPLEPDFYGYSFSVDGVSLHDPSNPAVTPNLLSVGNKVHVPGPASLP